MLFLAEKVKWWHHKPSEYKEIYFIYAFTSREKLMPLVGPYMNFHDIFSWFHKRPNLQQWRTNDTDSTSFVPKSFSLFFFYYWEAQILFKRDNKLQKVNKPFFPAKKQILLERDKNYKKWQAVNHLAG